MRKMPLVTFALLVGVMPAVAGVGCWAAGWFGLTPGWSFNAGLAVGFASAFVAAWRARADA